jgi:pre-rRNA-processing protein IPI3
MTPHCLQTQLRMVCPGPVNALTCTADGLFIAAGILEALYVWQTATGHLLTAVKAHYQNISCLSFTDDGSILVSGSEDCQVLVWDMAQLVCKTSLGDGNVVSEVSPRISFSHHTLPVLDLFIGHGGNKSLIASVSMDQTCKIYSLATGALLLNIVYSTGLTAVTMNAIDSEIFLGTADGRIISFLLHNAPRTPDFHVPTDHPSVFKGHDKAVVCLSVSIDCALLLSGSLDEKVIIWDIPSRQMLRILPHKGAVTNAIFTIAPRNVFSEVLKPSIILKSLLRHSGNEESRAVDVLVQGTTLQDDLQLQLTRIQEALDHGDVPAMTHARVEQGQEEVHKLRAINEGLYNFAVEKLLTPQQDVVETPVVVAPTELLTNINKKVKKKKNRLLTPQKDVAENPKVVASTELLGNINKKARKKKKKLINGVEGH